jgi:Arc/MetJ-type ribon-helix-helix transcriptional regulator
MTKSLPADLAEFVQHELAAGHFQSVEEMVCESLRLLRKQREQLDELKRELGPALERLDRGEGIVVKESEIRSYLERLFAEATADLQVKEPGAA